MTSPPGDHEPTDEPAPPTELLPGSADAAAHGCRCPVLANAAFRVGAEDAPVVAPDCPLHTIDPPR